MSSETPKNADVGEVVYLAILSFGLEYRGDHWVPRGPTTSNQEYEKVRVQGRIPVGTVPTSRDEYILDKNTGEPISPGFDTIDGTFKTVLYGEFGNYRVELSETGPNSLYLPSDSDGVSMGEVIQWALEREKNNLVKNKNIISELQSMSTDQVQK